MKKIIKITLMLNLLASLSFCESVPLKDLLLEEMNLRLRSKTSSKESLFYTLEDCLKLAVEKSGKLHIAKQEYKLSLINLKNSTRDLFPKADFKYEEIDGTTTGEDFQGKGYKFEMQYPIFSSGRIYKQFKQTKLNVQIAKIKHDQIFLDILNETEKAYYVFLEATLRKQSTMELKEIALEAKKSVKKQFDEKLARDIDWLETKILSKEVEQKILESKNDLILAEVSLRQMIDSYNAPVNIEKYSSYQDASIDTQQLVELAIINRPDIKLNRLLELVNQYSRDIAKSESKLKVSLDGYVGRRAENFVSEDLDYDDEYYVGVTGTLPLGRNTLETQLIDQDSVPSAGQTTSTEFQSYSVTLNLLDNKFNSSKLEGLIKYYKALEDSEKVKKAAIFEVGKSIIEFVKSYDILLINEEKLDLAQKKKEFQKLKVEANESSINDYLKESIAYFDARANFAKALSGYYSATADLNKAIGKPGFLNPINGDSGKNYLTDLLDQGIDEKPGFFANMFSSSKNDFYYPKQKYEDIKFKVEKDYRFLFGTRTRYIDPVDSLNNEKNNW